jgi:aryl-alcohol dehydrogenase-like predicted oxidoreductase
MTFGEDWGWGASREESRKIFDHFAEAGGNFIDTSCNYTEGSSERFVGDFISGNRDYFVVATKYSLRPNSADPKDPNAGGNGRKNLMRSVESSLRRLNTDTVDLLYLHMWDFTTPVVEVMRGLDDLVRSGKVLYVAFSDTPAWVVSYAVGLAEQHGWTRPIALQVPYSVGSRDPERDILPMAAAFDITVTAWGLLAGGVLTGKYNQDPAGPRRYEGTSERAKVMAERITAIAREAGQTPAQVAINWVRQRPYPIIPILGARTATQMRENLGVLDFELSSDCLAQLDTVSDFRLGFPMAFLTDEEVRGLLFGESFALLDNP